jgi:SAM-dependent methyltransferase
VDHAAYDPVASFYDRHWGVEFSRFTKAAFDTHLQPVLSEGATVLDLCCGTGLILAHLEALGLQATGVDESSKMLALARSIAPRASLVQADMSEFRSALRFDAVVSFYNSLNHARSFEHLRATLENIESHLKPGGYLLFDYMLPETFELSWEWCEQIEGDDGVRVVDYTYDRTSGLATCVIDGQARIVQTSFRYLQLLELLSDVDLSVQTDTAMAESGANRRRRLFLARKQ